MRREFLCSHHRQQLTEDPTAALNLWIKAMESGQRLYDSERYDDAVSMLGGAYEAAEILFQQHHISSTISVNHLTAACILLAKALNQDHQTNLCRVMLQSARNQIHRHMCHQTANTSFANYGSLCLAMLNLCYQELFNAVGTEYKASDGKSSHSNSPVKLKQANRTDNAMLH